MKLFWRALPWAAGILASAALAVAAGGFAAYYYLRPTLPSVEQMRSIPLQIPLRIYSRDGRLIGQVGERKRTPVDYEDIPEIVVRAFLAAEDDRFFEHPGFDYQGILRAASKLILTGSRAQGGSTITQQLAREYFLTRDRTFIRKGKELILAVQIENEFTKPEILALYLNKIFLGQRAYGVAAAAEVYFGKTLDQLTIAEAATIAGLPAAPSRLNPVANPDQARERRGYVLRRMRELDFISSDEYTAAVNTPMVSRLHGPQVDVDAPYAAEMARLEMVRLYGNNAYTDGYQVITTVDSELQRAAQSALRQALINYDRRHGYRGPLARTKPDEIIAAYSEQAVAAAEDGEQGSDVEPQPELDPARTREFALQEYLSEFPDYENIRVGIVTAINPETNGASVFLRDVGDIKLPWERIRWRRYINDDVVGEEPERVAQLLSVGDVIHVFETTRGYLLGQVPEAQGAFVALDPRDGATLAISGGFDYAASSFNRATQTLRQPGSAFKPFIYSAALENGFTAATIVNDAPIVLNSLGQEEAWRPENYSRRFYGPSRLREGLVRSMNLVSIRVLREVGLRATLDHLKPFGLPDSALPRDLSLALGTGGTSPWQLAEAYTGLASGGYDVDRYFIDRILDAEGKIVYAADPVAVCRLCPDHWYDGRELKTDEKVDAVTGTDDTEGAADVQADPQPAPLISPEVPRYESVQAMIDAAGQWRQDYAATPDFLEDLHAAPRIITPQNAYIVYDMMRDVIRRGTGRSARDLGRRDIAGKTGTSNNRRDAWFAGFNSEIVGIAWVGFDDDSRSLGAGEGGAATALPMWKNFMGVALEGTGEAPLEQPDGIVSVRISSKTGLLASYGAGDSMFEIFREDSVPAAETDELGYGDTDIFVEGDGDSAIF